MKDFYTYADKGLEFKYVLDQKPDPKDFEMHMHSKCEFCCIFSGKGIFRIEGSEYLLEPGDIFIMRPAEAHYIVPDKNEPYERISLHFEKDIFSEFDPDGTLTQVFFNRPTGALNRFNLKDFENTELPLLMERLKEKSDNPRLQIVSCLLPILYELYSDFPFKKIDYSKSHDTRIVQIINYINDNLYKELSLDSLCESFYISKSQLCRSFKKATASTVWDYITAKRLVFAKELMESGIRPTKVFRQCGFSDYSSFYRAYKNHFNVSPKEANIHPF